MNSTNGGMFCMGKVCGNIQLHRIITLEKDNAINSPYYIVKYPNIKKNNYSGVLNNTYRGEWEWGSEINIVFYGIVKITLEGDIFTNESLELGKFGKVRRLNKGSICGVALDNGKDGDVINVLFRVRQD